MLVSLLYSVKTIAARSILLVLKWGVDEPHRLTLRYVVKPEVLRCLPEIIAACIKMDSKQLWADSELLEFQSFRIFSSDDMPIGDEVVLVATPPHKTGGRGKFFPFAYCSTGTVAREYGSSFVIPGRTQANSGLSHRSMPCVLEISALLPHAVKRPATQAS